MLLRGVYDRSRWKRFVCSVGNPNSAGDEVPCSHGYSDSISEPNNQSVPEWYYVWLYLLSR